MKSSMQVLFLIQSDRVLSQYLWMWLLLFSMGSLRFASYFVNSMINYKES